MGCDAPALRATPVAAGLAALTWLPFVDRPATPDEGGYLLVASQWHLGGGGSSLYGDYWVDRPPLLITIYQVAHDLGFSQQGGVVTLRLLGVVAMVASVVLAARLGREIAPGSEGYAAVVAAALLTTPLFGGLNVNGELFATPLLLLGLIALLRADARDEHLAAAWFLAGQAGAAAAMVKQSQVDVVIAAAVVVLLRWRRLGPRPALLAARSLVLGAAGVTVVLLAWAWVHGTSPGALWSAVVAFRFHAAATIGTASGGVTALRALGLVGALVASGAPLLIWLLKDAPRIAIAVPLLVWEGFGVLFGGSYWLHYLVGLVPGLVVATACCVRAVPQLAGKVVAYLAVSAVVATLVFAAVGGRTPDDTIAAYLRAHRESGDTATVAFGRPHVVYDAGMSSPYDELWSLPVRVRDPHLTRLATVLAGPRRPDWLVVAGADLRTWGVDDVAAAQRQVSLHYRLVRRLPGYLVYHRRGPVLHPL